MAKSPDRIRQVQTTKERHGDDHYKVIGKKGSENSPTKFNSETGRKAVQKRWENFRARKIEEANEKKGSEK